MKFIQKNILFPALIIGGIFLLYQGIFTNEFSGLDDLLMIEENWDYLTDFNHITTAFTEDVFNGAQGTYYRPIQVISHMPDALLTQSSTPLPRVFFQLNLVFFITAFLLLYFFLAEFGFSPLFRLIFVGLMAIHPTLTPAVAWIPGRVDIILFLFVIGSLWSFIKFIKTQKRLWLIPHLILFGLGMFTKETTIVIPLISVLLFLYFKNESLEKNNSLSKFLQVDFWIEIGKSSFFWLKNNIGLPLGYAVLLLFWFFLRKNALPDSPFSLMGFIYHVAFSWKELVVLYGAIIFPLNLQVFLEFSWPYFFFGLIGLVGLFILPKVLKTNFKDIFLGFLWLFLFLFPTVLSDFINYHRLFIPLVGLAFILKPLDHQSIEKPWLALIIGVSGTLFLWQNLKFQKAFTHRISFWNNAITYSPNSAFANNGLAWSFHLDQEADSALKYYQRVVEIRPDRENVRMGMAIIHEERGDYVSADSLFNEEFKATKDSSQVYFYMGQVQLERGDTSKAIKSLTLGLPAQNSSRIARLYYDSLDIEIKNQVMN